MNGHSGPDSFTEEVTYRLSEHPKILQKILIKIIFDTICHYIRCQKNE